MNARQRNTNLDSKTIAKALRRVFGEGELDRIARDTGLMKRKRKVKPLMLLVACLSTLGVAKVQWLADILRTFNRFTGCALRYKPFHKQLAKPGFAEFLRSVVARALRELSIPVLRPLRESKLSKFSDIIIHDGSSFRVKDVLAKEWPGRFRKGSPAAMEIHTTMSAAADNVLRIAVVPDKEAERPFLPSGEDLEGRLLLADRGYEARQVFQDIDDQGGFFIIRGNMGIRPAIRRAYAASGHRLRHLEGKVLSLAVLPREHVDLDIEWRNSRGRWDGRIIALYTAKDRKPKTFLYLHTNLKRAEFRWHEIAALYRLRWQIELVFKEWKSHANLHRFDTSKSPIAEGLVWASLLVAIIKRYLCHAAQQTSGVELSTQRAASSARHFLDDVFDGLIAGLRTLQHALQRTIAFLEENARRAHPARDRRSGRLATGLRPIGVR